MPITRKNNIREQNTFQQHAHIPTPAWRPFIPSTDASLSDQDLSSDDTDDEAYLRLHHVKALEERARWNDPSKERSKLKFAPGKLNRPKYPTPQQCYQIVRRARKSFLQDRNPKLSTASPGNDFSSLRQSLRVPMKSYAKMESTFDTCIEEIQSAVKVLTGSKNNNNTYQKAKGQQLHLPPDEATTAVVTAAAKKLVQEAQQFKKRTEWLKNVTARLAKHTGAHVSTDTSFKGIERALVQANIEEEEEQQKSKEHTKRKKVDATSFMQCVKDHIDQLEYPELKDSFRLRNGYCLDGSRRTIEEDITAKATRQHGSTFDSPDEKEEDARRRANSARHKRHTSDRRDPVLVDASELLQSTITPSPVPTPSSLNRTPRVEGNTNHRERRVSHERSRPKPSKYLQTQKIKMRTPPRRQLRLDDDILTSDDNNELPPQKSSRRQQRKEDDDENTLFCSDQTMPPSKRMRMDLRRIRNEQFESPKPSIRERIEDNDYDFDRMTSSKPTLRRPHPNRPSFRSPRQRQERKSYRIVEFTSKFLPSGSSGERSETPPVSKFMFTPYGPSSSTGRDHLAMNSVEEVEDLDAPKNSSVVNLDDDI